MKIKKLEMKNWRGFYGSNHVIEFSTNKDKPITVLIGANETGKSDILRAIHWILFDDMPSDTSGPLDLINNYAEKEDKNAIAERIVTNFFIVFVHLSLSLLFKKYARTARGAVKMQRKHPNLEKKN